jgi:hypothetical protein
MRRALIESLEPVIQHIKKDGVSQAYANLIDPEPVHEGLLALYKRVGGYFGEQENGKFKTQMDWTAAVAKYVEERAGDRIAKINDTSLKRVQRVLSNGVLTGLGSEEVARNMIDSAGSITRGRLIARTEIVSASNLGAVQGAKATGLEMKKIWISTRDDRTRGQDPRDEFDHITIDGQTVQTMDSTFNVSGELMEFPGDYSHGARAGNLINCRCTVSFEPY